MVPARDVAAAVAHAVARRNARAGLGGHLGQPPFLLSPGRRDRQDREDRGNRLMTAARDEAGAVVRRAAQSTVASLFAAQARLHPERVAVVDGERALTYGTLDERSRRL